MGFNDYPRKKYWIWPILGWEITRKTQGWKVDKASHIVAKIMIQMYL